MSTNDIKTPALPVEEHGEGRFPLRALLIGLGAALLVGLVLLLSLNSGTSTVSASRGNLMLLLPAAFIAGLFSFLSPCTLPILPAYFAFTFQARRERVVMMTVAFFMGLATTLVVLGASATALSQLLFRNMQGLMVAGGLLVIAFGVMSFLGKGFGGMQILNRPAASVAGSYVYGATFALGWTACVGPILGTLLTMLVTQGVAVVQGGVLSFVYALGLGMPLIIVATFFSRLGQGSRFWQIMRGRGVSVNLGFTTLHLHSTSMISGALLIVMGVLLATGQLERLSAWTLTTPMAEWAFSIERQIDSFFFGR